MGFEAVVAPLLEVRPGRRRPIDLDGVGALAFTSANGVRAFAGAVAGARLWRSSRSARRRRAAARAAEGFAMFTPPRGDVAALASA